MEGVGKGHFDSNNVTEAGNYFVGLNNRKEAIRTAAVWVMERTVQKR